MLAPIPDSGQLDRFGEGDYVLPKGSVVHRSGIPVRLSADASVETHPDNARLVGAHKRMVQERHKRIVQERRKGPEIHSAKAHRCVDKVRAKGHAESNSWAICTASIGKRGVYAKGHGGNANPKGKVKEAREAAVARARARAERDLGEKWSDAARAASAAARRAKKKGGWWRKAAQDAYNAHPLTKARWENDPAYRKDALDRVNRRSPRAKALRKSLGYSKGHGLRFVS